MKQFAVVGIAGAGLFVYCRRCYQYTDELSADHGANYRRAMVVANVALDGLDAEDLAQHNAERHPS
ncbi:hypothetical protein ACIBSV_46805 [Embleya sp. NPDC050154]|uniref:hypothetical protein n=1 Tax=Embleya sp. NPDC050154 TaxID=3363988 RepID=UPI00378792C7